MLILVSLVEKGEGLVFRKGEVINKVPEDKLVDALFEELDKLIK